MTKQPEYLVTVTKDGDVTHWTVTDTPLSTVKRQATAMKAEKVVIEEPNGDRWCREASDTRWRREEPLPKDIKEITARMNTLQAELTLLSERLDAFKVKCDGCSCKILPGETCQCCAGREVLMRVLKARMETMGMPVSKDEAPVIAPVRNLNTKLN